MNIAPAVLGAGRATSATQAFNSVNNQPTADEVLVAQRITSDNLMSHVRSLSKVPRTGGTGEYRAAAQYVVDALIAEGWQARIEETGGGYRGPSFNVVADRKGIGSDVSRKLVVAGAHLDSVRSAPGANDNASGSSTLIETAKALRGIGTANDIRLIWFDREEQGLVGSAAYVAAHRDELTRAVVMLNADMVASPNGRVGFSVGASTTNAVGDVIKGVAERNGINATFLPERHSRSDHHSFDRAGVPTADFGVSVKTVAKEDPNYHSPRDTPDRLNPVVFEGFGDLFALSVLHYANLGERTQGPPPPRDAQVIDGPPL